MIDTFKAMHCGQTFEGAEGAKALELHMRQAHKARGLMKAGSDNGHRNPRGPGKSSPGWKNGEIEKPHPWKAPRPTPGGLEKVLADAKAGKYRVVYPSGMVAGQRQWIDAGHVEQAS